MPEILPNPFTDPKKLPKRSLFDRPESEEDEKQAFIDQAMAKGLEAAQESTKKKFSDPQLQKIWDNIEEKIESGEIKLHEITIGGKSKDQLIKEVESAGMKISDVAKRMMESKDFTVSETEEDLELIDLSVSDMGFQNGATREKIYQRAKELGLKIALAEVGPQLRLQYRDQPMDEYLVVGMEPLEDSSGLLRLFYVRHDSGGRFLVSLSGDPDDPWYSSYRFVFVRGK